VIDWTAAARATARTRGSAPRCRRDHNAERHAEVLIPKAIASGQLAAERDWLCGKNPRSFLAPRCQPTREWVDIAGRVEKILACRELRDVLRMLEKQNIDCSKPFLLGPQLFGIIHSVEARKVSLQAMSVLGGRLAEVRAHFHDASAKARALAGLVRRGPQPFVALAARDEVAETFTVFQPCPTIQSTNERAAIVPFDRLLDDVAASLDEAARKVDRRRQNQKTKNNARDAARSELRRLAITRLATAFRERFNHPCHSQIATIVEVLTGITTDQDHVKKLEKRDSVRGARGQKP
jgi:hypothetical protein